MHKKTDVIVNAFDGKLTSKRTVTSQVLKYGESILTARQPCVQHPSGHISSSKLYEYVSKGSRPPQQGFTG